MTSQTGSWSGAPKLAKVAWGILLVASVLGVVNHALGVFTIAERDPERLMFALFACLNVYATAVLLGPYRRGEIWAWLVTWIEVAAFALVYPFTGPEPGTWYLIGAGIAALAQAVSLPWFRSLSQGMVRADA
jgi:hypothetical protein